MADEPLEDSPTENGFKPEDEEKLDTTTTPGEMEITPNLSQGLGGCISPTPSGEELPEEETDKIISSTLDILKFCLTKLDDQKISCHSLTFMLLRIKESLDAYINDYIPKLNSFLVNADRITADYYARICCYLPKYGDYVKAVEAQESDPIAAGADHQIGKRQLHGLVKNVTDNYLAAAMNLKSSRAVLKDVNSIMSERTVLVYRINTPMPNWVGIQNIVTCQLEGIRNQTFQISAYLDFLKQGEPKTGATLDLTAQEKTNKAKKPSVKPVETENQPVKPLEPNTTFNKTDEPSEPTTVNQTEISDDKKDAKPSVTEEDSDDDIFDPKGRIRKYNK